MHHFLLLAHVCATLLMTGVIWVIQLVHYPMFSGLDARQFKTWQGFHCRRISIIVAPLMLTELCTAMVLFPPLGFESYTRNVPSWFSWSALPLVVVLWGSTCFIQSPTHAQLEKGFSEDQIERLVRWNWIRTLVWSLRTAACMILLWQACPTSNS